jgi:hypothetical protein
VQQSFATSTERALPVTEDILVLSTAPAKPESGTFLGFRDLNAFLQERL